MQIHCNAGIMHSNLIGDLPGYGIRLWYHINGIANKISLSKNKHKVTYESSIGNQLWFISPMGPLKSLNSLTLGSNT